MGIETRLITLSIFKLNQLVVVAEEVGILQEEVGSEMRVSGAVGDLAIGVMAEMNSETKGSFQCDREVQLVTKKIALGGLVRMEVGGADAKVGQTATQ